MPNKSTCRSNELKVCRNLHLG